MKFPTRETWIEYLLVAMPAAGLTIAWFRPETELILLVTAAIATLPFFLSTLRGLLDRRIAAEAFPALALVLLLISREWQAAASISLILGVMRLIEQRLEMRAVAALRSADDDATTYPSGDEIVTVETGARIPADGIIVYGTAFVNQGLVTGNPEAVERLTGDPVFAGTIVQAGSIRLRVQRSNEPTLVARMQILIRNAHQWPSPAERIAGHASAFSYWVLAVVATATWFFTQDIGRLAAVLLVLRPDALGAAVTLAASLGAAAASRLGALIHGGDALDQLAAANILVLDKSGPLTFVETRVGRLEHDPDVSDAYIWECVAVAEGASNHPVGRALYREAMRHVGRASHADSRREEPGRGVIATLGGHEIVIGTAELHRTQGVTFDGAWLAGSTTPVDGRLSDTFLALDGRCVARLRVEERPRADVRSALDRVRALGFQHDILLTPDTIRIAAKQSATIGLSDYRPSMSAEEKWTELGRLSREGNVLMIGDGIVDAKAMQRAHIGIAMSAGGAQNDAARITFVSDDLSRIPDLVVLARTFRQVIRRQSIIWIAVGGIGLSLTALDLLSPVSAAGYALASSTALHVFMWSILPKKHF